VFNQETKVSKVSKKKLQFLKTQKEFFDTKIISRG
jgi:hypothetical protein